MADANIKMRRGSLSALPTTKTDGHLYFATMDNSAVDDDGNYSGYIYLDSNGKRYSFGRFVEYADNAGNATRADHAETAGSADSATSATSASKATQLATTRYIDGVGFNGTANIHHYTTCSTAAGTAAKTASLTGFKLATGSKVIIKFTNGNTASGATLNVQSTGAKNIVYKNNNLSVVDSWQAGSLVEFVYNGSAWEMIGGASGKAIFDGNGNVITDTYATKYQGIYYIEGTGSTAGTWGGTHSEITEYYSGLTIAYKIPVEGASTTKLEINSLGLVDVVKNATTEISTSYAVNSIIILTYTEDNGTPYWKIADYNTNTNTQIRVYRQTSGYDNEYPLLVSRTLATSIGTAGSNSSYDPVYGVFREKSSSDRSPTLTANPAAGTITAKQFKGLADQATADGSGQEIFSTYINGLSVSNIDFANANSQDNLYLRAYIPSGKILPNTDAEKPKYIIPAANDTTPGLLSLTAQNIHGDKTFANNVYFANGTDYFIDNTASGKLRGLIVDVNADLDNSLKTVTNSILSKDKFNIAFNNNDSGILFTPSGNEHPGFIQYKYTSSLRQFILGIHSNTTDDKNQVVIQSPGDNNILHYNTINKTYSTMLDTGNFKNLQISIFGSTTDYNFKNNSNKPDFVFDGFTSSPLIYAGNAYQDMSNTVEDSAVSSGINADKLNGCTYLDIAAEMILSNDEISEIIG